MLGLSLGITSIIDKPSGFNPSTLSGLKVWLDGSDSSSIIHSSGAVSQWSDKSGNANHFVQATSPNQPTTNTRTLNGKNALNFDGNSDMLSCTNASALAILTGQCTVFCVASRDVLTGDYTLLTSGGAGTGAWGVSNNDTSANARQTTQWGVSTLPVTNDLLAHTIGMHTNGATNPSNRVFRDGIFGGTYSDSGSTVTVATLINLGAVNTGFGWWDGAIGEVLIFNRALSNTELNNVGNYLKSKWGTLWTNV